MQDAIQKAATNLLKSMGINGAYAHQQKRAEGYVQTVIQSLSESGIIFHHDRLPQSEIDAEIARLTDLNAELSKKLEDLENESDS